MVERTIAQYIGRDPVVWVERLQYVNDQSNFPPDAKAIIAGHLKALRGELLFEDLTNASPR